MVSPLHVFLAYMDEVLVLLLVMMLVVVAVVVVLVSFLWFDGSIASRSYAGVLCFELHVLPPLEAYLWRWGSG